MCGILYARLRCENDLNFAEIFNKALNLMAYRGSDDIGYYQLANNFFGHVRLSILDLSSRSNQPVINSQHVILFKGEIYNYKQLVSNAPSDTLAVAQLIESGVDVSTKLRGMYALLIYDIETQAINIFRDFYGEKPVYYYLDDKIFIVSSTIKSIQFILNNAFNIKPKLNHAALYDYFLCGYIREPKTIYENINMLSSAHKLTFSANWKLEIINLFQQILQQNTLDSAQHTEYCLRTTDVEPAILLSSGVDSTYLLSLMQDSDRPFRVWTYKAISSVLDESSAAIDNLRKICGDNVQAEILENHKDMHDLYISYPFLLEQPSSDGMNLFNILSVSRENHPGAKLIILGTGGDELYGGYHSFTNYNRISWFRRFAFLKKLYPLRYRRFFAISHGFDHVESYYFLYRMDHLFLNMTSNEIIEQLFLEFRKEMEKYKLPELKTPAHKIKLFESMDYMRNQLLRDADNISLYCNYEARNPLLTIQAFLKNPDFKISMKQWLWKKYRITFHRKKGFTLDDHDKHLIDFLCLQVNLHNEKYRILSPTFLKQIFQTKKPNLSLIKKIYILLAWLDANEIKPDQLQEFSLGFPSNFCSESRITTKVL